MSMLIRRRPFARSINRHFEPFNEFESLRNSSHALALDVDETETGYVVSAVLPGVKADDIEIRLHDDVLTIAAEVNDEHSEEEGRRVIRERHYGKFSRNLRFPVGVNSEEIEANYADGVLTLNVPKVEEAQPLTIPVKVANGNSKN